MNRQLSQRLFTGGLVAVIGLCLSIGLSYLPLSRTGAQTSTPSAKATMQMGNLAVMAGNSERAAPNPTGLPLCTAS